MNILRLLALPVIALVLFTGQPCSAQILLDIPEDANNDDSISRASVKSQPLRICNKEDQLSNAFCKCSERVVSCDFSKYSGDTNGTTLNSTNTDNNKLAIPPNILELELYGFQFPPKTARVCICNAPPNLHLNFSLEHFLPLPTNRMIQRFDLFNLTGVTHFMGGFKLNFNGDLYVANVSQIPKIHKMEFGRGSDDPIQNVQDLECCSPIKLNQNHKKPVLLIENSTVDLIGTHGLTDNHLWKTLIIKSATFNNIQEYGISFLLATEKGYDVAILGSTFKNATNFGMRFEDASNMFLAMNSFTHSNNVSTDFFGSRSLLNNSNVLLIDNLLWNAPYMNLDARRVISWYNIFDLWDNVTFDSLKHSSFAPSANLSTVSQRSISFKYNSIRKVVLSEGSIDFGTYTSTTMADNVLGTCNCSIFMIKDKVVKPELNWCYAGEVLRTRGKCSIRLNAAFRECNKSNSVNFEKLCDDKAISMPGVPHVGANLTEDVEKMLIPSDFISRIVKEFHLMFGTSRVTKLSKLLTDEVGTSHDGKDKPNNSGRSKKSSIALPIIVTLTVIVVFVVLGILVYRRKHVLLRFTGRQELINESRNEMA